jgi:GNAT superfamily N-acetyltransferase
MSVRPPAFAVRPATASDTDVLTAMLVEAVNWNPDRPRREADDVLADPALARYVVGWPRPGDLGVIAVDPLDRPIGACWLRSFSSDEPGYGFVAADVPEIGLAVSPAWRRRGVGRALLRELVEIARRTGIRRLSLAVESGNRARELYLSEGFVVHAADGEGVKMVKDLSRP